MKNIISSFYHQGELINFLHAELISSHLKTYFHFTQGSLESAYWIQSVYKACWYPGDFSVT